ncbi:MAG: hypothetical protein H0V45_00620, partial [Actinobacteria bacterium]|nr:hypothetical protein [Actinomycetota bacterium]
LEGRRREYRNAALARNLAASLTSGSKPNTEQLRAWRSLSAAERFQAWEHAGLPERRGGGAITFVGPMKGER